VPKGDIFSCNQNKFFLINLGIYDLTLNVACWGFQLFDLYRLPFSHSKIKTRFFKMQSNQTKAILGLPAGI